MKKRLRDSAVGNFAVIAVTAVVILAGVWVVNSMTGDGEAKAKSTASETAAVSQITTTGKARGPAPKVGKAAPDFTTIAVDGKEVSLASLRGKPAWLVFGATWCTECRAETPDVEALQKKYGDKVNIVAIYVEESISTAEKYAERLGLSYKQVADSYGDVSTSYRVMGVPTHFFIDSEGTLKAIEIGALTERAAGKQVRALLAD